MFFVGTNFLSRDFGTDHSPGTGELVFETSVSNPEPVDREKERLILQIIQSQGFEAVAMLMGRLMCDMADIVQFIHYHAETGMTVNDPEESRSHFGKIHKASGRVFDMVGHFWRIWDLTDNGNVGHVNMKSIVSCVVDLVEKVFPKGIEVRPAFEPGGDYVLTGNPVQLRQALLNLVINAAQAMPSEQGRIDVSLRVERLGKDGYLVLSVKDNGMGMDARTLDKIFTPFFTTKPKWKGTGLGLSTTRDIVAAHNGEIRVTSDVGRGSLFQVYFPGGENG